MNENIGDKLIEIESRLSDLESKCFDLDMGWLAQEDKQVRFISETGCIKKGIEYRILLANMLQIILHKVL